MKLVVGLGNPGRKYSGTRHNVGFEVVGRLASKFGAESPRMKFDAEMAEVTIGGERTLLMLPQTFMNRSGQAVQAALAFYKLAREDLLVVCDDFNLPCGRLRLRPDGSSGGQRGLENIAQLLGSDQFSRLRLGIGPVPPQWDAADFVLGKFTAEDEAIVAPMLQRASDAVECWIADGIAAAMNEYNTVPVEPPRGGVE
jgi:PTH1 family peptidyl-tRNA hydrolase